MSKLYVRKSLVSPLHGCICRAVVCLISAALPIAATAQAGQLDTSFGTGGIFSSNFNNASPTFATCVALQSDGKLIVGGEIGNPGVIVRLNTNGTLDTSFGTGGVVSIVYSDVENFTVGVAVQSDGKIVAVGTGLPDNGQLIRLNPNGSMDTTFGSGGSVRLNLTPSVLALQSNGEILINGTQDNRQPPVLIRYTTNGQIDTTFGSGGMAPLTSPATALAFQPNGQILVGSGSPLGVTGGPGVLARYNTDGSIDTFFGIQGQVSDLVGPTAVAVQANGQIVTAGTITSSLSLSGNDTGFGLTEYFPTGLPIFLFGSHGGAITPFPNFPSAVASSIAIQPNQFIVAAGQAVVGVNISSFALARYVPTGQLDPSFGTAGLVTTSFGNTTSSISGIALQTDGKIVAAGAGGTNFVVARYLGQ